ncbi:hypothetical protein RMR21_016200 [Agrobacterium sp. rho-8.1]|nr:hypothetical protein [Agrobacterium sp. rho-8.1]
MATRLVGHFLSERIIVLVTFQEGIDTAVVFGEHGLKGDDNVDRRAPDKRNGTNSGNRRECDILKGF